MSKTKKILLFLAVFITSFLLFSYHLQKELLTAYNLNQSVQILDREGKEIALLINEKESFSRYLDEVPGRFKELLIKKEDKYFFYHFGFNPLGIYRVGLKRYFGIGKRKASSTLSQQLVKILLEKEFDRSLKNKIFESFYTLSLEIFQNKEEILKMYVNSVHFGNQAQGLTEASRIYFKTDPELLTDSQILQLLITIDSPSLNNPARPKNKEFALSLAEKMKLTNQELIMDSHDKVVKNIQEYVRLSNTFFEVKSLSKDFSENNHLTLDKSLTEKIREIVQRNIENLSPKNVRHGAVMVIKFPENEILALIGSPDPLSFEDGYQINMLNRPRPIGSTVKPFIYLKSFEKGLRPYTLIDDREYKYATAYGLPLYPKNFDYRYRGEVNLHYALSNSLNVPTLKVLEYAGLENFYKFLEEDLEFKPVQNLDSYQLGIALGALEMSLWNLTKYFTIFPNQGVLKELKIYKNGDTETEKKVSEEKYIQLVNKILNDRKTGIDQFGLVSELNLFQENYALKTGTSRDFHDSWIVGFTPDFLVGVWVGNAENTPMEAISGQIGAGRIWSEVMQLIFHSQYNKKTPFNFNYLEEFYKTENIEYGLDGDDYEEILNILKERDTALILIPHHNDTFLLEKDTKIILQAKENVSWFIDQEFFGKGERKIFIPRKTGQYQIRADSFDETSQTITIYIQNFDF